MEAQLLEHLPEADGWQYEPKWDGFRGVLENDGGELALWSRNGRPLLRYFPELRPLGELLPPHSALDGEIVIAEDGRLEFDNLQLRLHPAESRINKLAGEIPADFIAFDILLWNGEEVHRLPLEERRSKLEELAAGFRVSPVSRDRDLADAWLDRLEPAGLDGVVCKRLDLPYLPGSRDGVVKVKRHKTADCVVVGVRWKAKPDQIATLLLGLHDDEDQGDDRIHYVGTTVVSPRRHAEVAEQILPLLEDAPERRFSESNRWGTGELEESAVRPEVVVEIRYDKVQGHRFRHGTRFLRFRPDKNPAECTWSQVRPPRRADDLTVEALLSD
jgi:ATP-dependent DNA ligase